MATGKKTGGRLKGTPNKLTAMARDVIAHAAEKLGGKKRLAEWAAATPENETAFWTRIYPRLLPVQLTGPDDGPIQVERIEWIVREVDERILSGVSPTSEPSSI